ncbi:hypothetical protein F5Y07DRAFT_398316 [Xylaria sp. FL0933]|nr:hypothetical protein F5Y07DRAFT_398316 [Xylaria sp. FL0933]
MDTLVNGCRGRAAAIRREAQRRLDDLVSKPWHADSKVTEDISRVRHQVDILKASNALSSAELLDIAHPCDVCDAAAPPASTCATCTHDAVPGTTHKSCAVCLATGLMRNLDDKKAKMQTITDQIHNRSALITKFEDHLKTYENISKSLNIVAPEDKMEYYYKIDTRRGVNLVINERKNSGSIKDETKFFKASDIMDPETLIPPPTPVLKPVDTRRQRNHSTFPHSALKEAPRDNQQAEAETPKSPSTPMLIPIDVQPKRISKWPPWTPIEVPRDILETDAEAPKSPLARILVGSDGVLVPLDVQPKRISKWPPWSPIEAPRDIQEAEADVPNSSLARILVGVNAQPELISKETPHNIPKVERADSGPEQEPKSLLEPQSPILQIWDTEEERVRCLRENTGSSGPLNPDYIPLIFKHGIQYKPHDLSSGSISPTSSPTDCSRMVVFSNVHTETTWEELLSAVRGGPILRATRADATTWFVFFVRGRDAQAYTDATRTRHTVVHEQIVCVALAPTPSYPVRAALMQDIAQRGVTRCLGFPRYDAVFGRMLETCLLPRKIGDFVVSKQVGVEMPALIPSIAGTAAANGVTAAVTTSISTSSNTSSTNFTSASMVARRDESEKEEWIVLEDEQGTARFTKVEKQKNSAEQSQGQVQKQEQQVTPPTPTKMNIVHFAFRDIVHAQAAYRAVCAEFPNCGVFYAPDPCAGPLSELA